VFVANRYKLLLLLSLLALAACTLGPRAPGTSAGEQASDEEAYAAFQGLLNQSREFRQAFVGRCSERLRERSKSDRSRMAAVLDVPEPFIETEFCTRIANLVASGRLSFEDFEALRSPSTETRKMDRLMKLIMAEPGAGTWI
jgi:hypothetical protein